jgi:hypothetical protein
MNKITQLAFFQNLHFSEILMIALIALFWIVPFWMIFKKAGYHPAVSLLIFVPLVNVILIYFLAFAPWPVHREDN